MNCINCIYEMRTDKLQLSLNIHAWYNKQLSTKYVLPYQWWVFVFEVIVFLPFYFTKTYNSV